MAPCLHGNNYLAAQRTRWRDSPHAVYTPGVMLEPILPDVRTLLAHAAPRVSVVIPSLDGERGGNVARLIAQLESQTMRELEALVVVGVRPNGRARNVGARRARGDFLFFIDDDVQLGHDDLIERMLAAFDEDPSIALVGCSQQLPPNASPFERRCARQLDRVVSPVVEQVEDTDMATHMCMAMRREQYHAVGGEHEHLPRGTDPELRARLRAAGFRVVLAAQTWAYHPPPRTWSEIWRIYRRNGFGSRYVADQFPRGTLPTSAGHGDPLRTGGTMARGAGYLARVLRGLTRGQLIRLASEAAYGVGYLNAWLWEPQWRRIKAKQLALRYLATPVGRLARRRSAEPGIRILLYHRIGARRHRNLMVHYEDFAAQMAWLAKTARVISLEQALRCLEGETPLPDNAVVVTFDDITHEWEDLALPVLQRHNLPATVFLAAGTVDSEVEFPWLRHEEPPDYHGVTTQQLRRLAAAGVSIGAHTYNHPRLSGLSPSDQEHELRNGRARLEALLDTPVVDLAYPYGRVRDVPDTAVALARELGFRCGLTVRPGVCRPGADLFRLGRTAIDPGDTPGLFRRKVDGTLDVLAWRDR